MLVVFVYFDSDLAEHRLTIFLVAPVTAVSHAFNHLHSKRAAPTMADAMDIDIDFGDEEEMAALAEADRIAVLARVLGPPYTFQPLLT